MAKLKININTDKKNGRILEDGIINSSVSVYKDIKFIKCLEEEIKLLEISDILTKSIESLNPDELKKLEIYLKKTRILNLLYQYSKNELPMDSKSTDEVQSYIKGNFLQRIKKMLSEEQIAEANSILIEFDSWETEALANFLNKKYSIEEYTKLSLQEAYILELIYAKYISRISIEWQDKLRNERNRELENSRVVRKSTYIPYK